MFLHLSNLVTSYEIRSTH